MNETTRKLGVPLTAAILATAAFADEPAPSAPTADLGSVLVEGSAISKYRPESVSSGSFTDMAPEALPLVVDTLTDDFIREHNPTDLHDLLRYVPGIESGGKSLLVRSPGQFSIRGMGGTEPTFDGILPIGRGPGLFMDPFLMDRIEIAKGPIAALAGGAGSVQNASGAGGSVSMFLKSASLDGDKTELRENTSFGKNTSRVRAMVDSNQSTAEGLGAVRVVATADIHDPAYTASGSQKGASARESWAVAPSAVFSAGEDLTFGIKSLFQYTEQPSYIGVPVWRGRPGGGYSWDESSCRPDDRSDYRSMMLFPWADWRVADGWLLKFGASMMISEWSQRTREPYTPGIGTTELDWYCRTGTWLSGKKYMTSGFSESSAIMHNYNVFVRSVHDTEFENAVVSSNSFVVQPDYGYRSSSGGFGTPTSRYGITVQDSFAAGPFTFLAGVRTDHFEQESYSAAGRGGVARYPSISANAVSPRAGMSLRPIDWLVIFGNVSQTRTPMLGLRRRDGTTPDDPWRATQEEAGVRLRAAERLWLTTAFYRIDQEHVPEFDNDGYVEDYDGESASHGAELSLSGDITDDWTVLAMYSWNEYTDKTVPRGSPGRSFARYPRNVFSLNTSYRISSGALENVVIGGGWRFRSKSYATMRGSFVDENLRFDSSHVFDVNATIPFSVFGGADNWALTLGVRNLFDERYFESARHYYECLVGEPRTFEIGLKAEF